MSPGAKDSSVILVYQNHRLFQFMPTRAASAEMLEIFRTKFAGMPRRWRRAGLATIFEACDGIGTLRLIQLAADLMPLTFVRKTSAFAIFCATTVALGTVSHAANELPRISLAEMMRMQAELTNMTKPCLSPLPPSIKVTLKMRLNPGGTLAGKPELVSGSSPAAGNAVIRAVTRCVTKAKPLDFDPALYPAWKTFQFSVTPQGQ
jgi:hypothetical protein